MPEPSAKALSGTAVARSAALSASLPPPQAVVREETTKAVMARNLWCMLSFRNKQSVGDERPPVLQTDPKGIGGLVQHPTHQLCDAPDVRYSLREQGQEDELHSRSRGIC